MCALDCKFALCDAVCRWVRSCVGGTRLREDFGVRMLVEAALQKSGAGAQESSTGGGQSVVGPALSGGWDLGVLDSSAVVADSVRDEGGHDILGKTLDEFGLVGSAGPRHTTPSIDVLLNQHNASATPLRMVFAEGENESPESAAAAIIAVIPDLSCLLAETVPE